MFSHGFHTRFSHSFFQRHLTPCFSDRFLNARFSKEFHFSQDAPKSKENPPQRRPTYPSRRLFTQHYLTTQKGNGNFFFSTTTTPPSPRRKGKGNFFFPFRGKIQKKKKKSLQKCSFHHVFTVPLVPSDK